ncbi:Precorrin-2 C(20)-methyltransferase [hydrothermal vent metagenome]|uniref:Precorrin-2 C(20)-methyltransferase n=1 Tax=hydrothermal vent metagenome TaxID=652676 RepID=A0A3B0TH42_9ZZZZ
MAGTLHLIGVGPGDPDLITLKAAKILVSVNMVAFPQKPGIESLALKIAAPHLRKNIAQMPIILPMKTSRQPAKDAYDQAAMQIGEQLDAGISIAYLCEGDPFFYGSAMYLFSRLAHQYNVQIVPGISSLNAAAAAINRPLAARDEILKILPATLDDKTLLEELKNTEAAAIIKVGRHFDRVKKIIVQSGHAKGAMVIEFASQPHENIRKISAIDAQELSYFSIILCYRGQEMWGQKAWGEKDMSQ